MTAVAFDYGGDLLFFEDEDSYLLRADGGVVAHLEGERWYVDRFFALRETVFRDPDSFFTKYAHLTDDEARATATSIWDRINWVNLREHIQPTRERASLILRKGHDHRIDEVRLLTR